MAKLSFKNAAKFSKLVREFTDRVERQQTARLDPDVEKYLRTLAEAEGDETEEELEFDFDFDVDQVDTFQYKDVADEEKEDIPTYGIAVDLGALRSLSDRIEAYVYGQSITQALGRVGGDAEKATAYTPANVGAIKHVAENGPQGEEGLLQYDVWKSFAEEFIEMLDKYAVKSKESDQWIRAYSNKRKELGRAILTALGVREGYTGASGRPEASFVDLDFGDVGLDPDAEEGEGDEEEITAEPEAGDVPVKDPNIADQIVDLEHRLEPLISQRQEIYATFGLPDGKLKQLKRTIKKLVKNSAESESVNKDEAHAILKQAGALETQIQTLLSQRTKLYAQLEQEMESEKSAYTPEMAEKKGPIIDTTEIKRVMEELKEIRAAVEDDAKPILKDVESSGELEIERVFYLLDPNLSTSDRESLKRAWEKKHLKITTYAKRLDDALDKVNDAIDRHQADLQNYDEYKDLGPKERQQEINQDPKMQLLLKKKEEIREAIFDVQQRERAIVNGDKIIRAADVLRRAYDTWQTERSNETWNEVQKIRRDFNRMIAQGVKQYRHPLKTRALMINGKYVTYLKTELQKLDDVWGEIDSTAAESRAEAGIKRPKDAGGRDNPLVALHAFFKFVRKNDPSARVLGSAGPTKPVSKLERWEIQSSEIDRLTEDQDKVKRAVADLLDKLYGIGQWTPQARREMGDPDPLSKLKEVDPDWKTHGRLIKKSTSTTKEVKGGGEVLPKVKSGEDAGYTLDPEFKKYANQRYARLGSAQLGETFDQEEISTIIDEMRDILKKIKKSAEQAKAEGDKGLDLRYQALQGEEEAVDLYERLGTLADRWKGFGNWDPVEVANRINEKSDEKLGNMLLARDKQKKATAAHPAWKKAAGHSDKRRRDLEAKSSTALGQDRRSIQQSIREAELELKKKLDSIGQTGTGDLGSRVKDYFSNNRDAFNLVNRAKENPKKLIAPRLAVAKQALSRGELSEEDWEKYFQKPVLILRRKLRNAQTMLDGGQLVHEDGELYGDWTKDRPDQSPSGMIRVGLSDQLEALKEKKETAKEAGKPINRIVDEIRKVKNLIKGVMSGRKKDILAALKKSTGAGELGLLSSREYDKYKEFVEVDKLNKRLNTYYKQREGRQEKNPVQKLLSKSPTERSLESVQHYLNQIYYLLGYEDKIFFGDHPEAPEWEPGEPYPEYYSFGGRGKPQIARSHIYQKGVENSRYRDAGATMEAPPVPGYPESINYLMNEKIRVLAFNRLIFIINQVDMTARGFGARNQALIRTGGLMGRPTQKSKKAKGARRMAHNMADIYELKPDGTIKKDAQGRPISLGLVDKDSREYQDYLKRKRGGRKKKQDAPNYDFDIDLSHHVVPGELVELQDIKDCPELNGLRGHVRTVNESMAIVDLFKNDVIEESAIKVLRSELVPYFKLKQIQEGIERSAQEGDLTSLAACLVAEALDKRYKNGT